MTPLDTLCINTIRILSAEAVQKARSGHPGMPMGAAAPAYVLWTRFLRHNPGNPAWPNRDRFLLSAGHGSMLLYSLLHLCGYDLSLDDIQRFRQWGSRTPGHPERGTTPGVEITTGPLGQGFAHGVGMAMAERYLAQRFNRPGHDIVDHHIYAIVSDGDLMEGLSHEAASLAGHLKLGKIIYLYDDNRITIEGSTALSLSDATRRRFESYGWQACEVDGNDLEGLTQAIESARATTEQPSLIITRTHIGHGSPTLQDSEKAHGAPLGEEELRRTKAALGWPPEPAFHVPEEVRGHFREALRDGETREREWREGLETYARLFPEEKAEWDHWQSDGLPTGWDEDLRKITIGPKPAATRGTSGQALNALAGRIGNLVGGSADLGQSNKTVIEGRGDFVPGAIAGPNIHFGVREHAMAAAVNGMALHGGLRPYGGTFLVFCDYMRPALRLAAMMQARSIFVFTHDSIGVGEDGPTHQPTDQLAALRAIPGLTVIRPADAHETTEAWWVAVQYPGPSALILTRQKVPPLPRTRLRMPEAGALPAPEWADAKQPGAIPPLARGAHVLSEASLEGQALPELILIGTGSEVAICLEAQTVLEERGVATRVVSMPSWELFEEQPPAYREFVLPARVTARLAVEAAIPLGWERYTGRTGATVTMQRFGASAPQNELFEQFGFTTQAVISKATALLKGKVPTNS